MPTDDLKRGLEKSSTINNWKTVGVSYDHNKHPNQYTSYDINFEKNDLQIRTIKDILSTFTHTIDKKYSYKAMTYTGSNPKTIIDELSIEDPLIKDNWSSLIGSTILSDNTTKLKEVTISAYIFIGYYQDGDKEKCVYLITRKNPILNYTRKKILIYLNEVKECNTTLIQFNKCCDALIFDGMLYTINSNFESILNMEYTHKIVCNQSLESIKTYDIVDDFDSYSEYAKKGQTPKRFINYDTKIMEALSRTDIQKKVEDRLHIKINSTNHKYVLDEDEKANLFTNLICGRIKLDFITEAVCEVSSSVDINP